MSVRLITGDMLERLSELEPDSVDAIVTDPPYHLTNPTVKPTALMRYLCRMVTPKGGLILDPFMGSGSTGKAAVREGFSFIGVELNPEYVEIARRRIHSDAPLFAEVE